MIGRIALFGLIGLVGAVSLGLFLTRAAPLPRDAVAPGPGDAQAGARIFALAGCASCHTAPGAADSDRPVLAGGQRFETDFGAFLAPNISPHPTAGIGDWDLRDFASALQKGVSPDGRHYYPAFPYAAYAGMRSGDVADLWAFVQTLPADATPSAEHELGFPYSIRRGLALWKLRYLRDGPAVAVPASVAEGQYIAEALGHCAECHTPRSALGGLQRGDWLEGAPNPSGRGRIPGLTPAQLGWSAEDIAYYLETGFTPEFDSAGGQMAKVVANYARVRPEDRAAVAAYLLALP